MAEEESRDVSSSAGSPAVEAVATLGKALNATLAADGMEAAPFLVGWYNELVVAKPGGSKYAIDAAPDAVAFMVASTPHMWPRFKAGYALAPAPSDPVDAWCAGRIAAAIDALGAAHPTLCPEGSVKVLSEGWDRRRYQPYILVQTAGHVAGMARLYREEDVTDTTWLDAWKVEQVAAGKPAKAFPVAVHPRYGGWFAYRAALVVTTLRCPGLPKREPEDIMRNDEGRSRALIKFNSGWLDRELGLDVEARYEAEAVEYFSYLTAAARKKEMLRQFIREGRAAAGLPPLEDERGEASDGSDTKREEGVGSAAAGSSAGDATTPATPAAGSGAGEADTATATVAGERAHPEPVSASAAAQASDPKA